MPAQREPSESPAMRAFATELTAWRDNQPKAELAEILGYTPQFLSQLEAGKNIPSKRFAEDLDTHFKTNGLFVRLWKLIVDTKHLLTLPPGFAKYVALEKQANAVRVFCLVLITGLLQTEEYAREILRGIQRPEEVEQFVVSRMERQTILNGDKAPRLWVTLDERALRSVVGGRDLMRRQLEHLLEVADRPNVMIQVVPHSTNAYTGLGGDFILLSFKNEADVAYIEMAGRGQVIEDTQGVSEYHVRYDLVRGHALPVAESRKLIKSTLESL